MREIHVRGSSRPALVDDEDFARINQRTWRLTKSKDPRKVRYAVSDERTANGIVKFLMHREVLAAQAGTIVDHRDRDGLNNQRSNLRIATSSQNLGNSAGKYTRRSRFKGVGWEMARCKWRASIRNEHIGRFDTEEGAARAYDARAIEIWGEFAYLNFPMEGKF